jgi:hypothetical protein
MPISPDDVERVFDDACIRELATLAHLPAETDLARFGVSVRYAVKIYIAKDAEPTPNALHREIKALYEAAQSKQYHLLAKLLEQMTPAAQRVIDKRRSTLSRRLSVLNWRIPDATELRDPARRGQAAEGLRALIIRGMERRERKRPSGRPTISIAPRLYAPSASFAEPRRAAERVLVMWLQVAVAETSAKVALTAHHSRPGPFARMVARVLEVAGVCGEKAKGRAVRAINDLNATRVQEAAGAGAACHEE